MTQTFPYKTSFWATEDVIAQNPLGTQSIEADVVIIGAGFAGMSSAYYIKKARPDARVVVLEKEYVGFGPSGRNFGAVVPGLRELRTVFLTDIDPAEEAFAQQWYLGARGELERRIAEGGIECEYREEPLLMQSLDEESWEAQQRESELLTRRGTPHILLDRAAFRQAMDLPFDTFGGIVRTAWRAVQPFKLARGFGAQLKALGIAVHEATAVTGVADDGSRVTITTAEGGVVKAKKAVLATNAYTRLLDQFSGMIWPRHTHVIATEVLPDDVFNSLGYRDYKFVEDSGLTFYYTRVYKNRLLMGGGASSHGLFHMSSVDAAADRDTLEFQRIYDEMQRRFPQLAGVGIDAAWGGPVDMTDNFMPIIKPLDDLPNVISQIGFNGDGLLNGSITGKMVKGLVLGDEYVDPAAERIRQYMARA
ncbi:FAD-binding oxidoreductase [Sphingomonas sp. CL5.1]|uniref:NAD(P)/FAD-dependent oxidoreductase n=1 Tax=Sphingomonas sp. CL5.1 TaxID=2653203 RepID=UPI001583E635|nr:FAD-dependent oxidoreductase [Sphingomonas sp. CL5.1]QKR99871.1 FAD-binding oxidoreductase [Sphingomonas sp. CL5.1]